MRHITKLAGLAALAAFPATAGAHVTLQPDSAAGGGFTREDVRVPNERDDASTTKVVIQLPPGFVFASTEPVPGWKVTIDKAKLAKPVKTDDGEVTEEVRQITWTGDGKTGKIGPGQFQDFGLSVQIPEKKAGTELTFKALQTYSDGDVVRWIGPPDAEEPAPQVKVTAAEAEEHAAPAAATAAPEAEDDGGPSTGLVIVALALGAAGLVAGAAGLATARRKAG
jgi:uncharacterized protein